MCCKRRLNIITPVSQSVSKPWYNHGKGLSIKLGLELRIELWIELGIELGTELVICICSIGGMHMLCLRIGFCLVMGYV